MKMNSYVKAKPAMTFTSLRDMVFKTAEKFGDKTLYIYTEGKERKTWSFRDLKNNMLALGTAFSKLDLLGKRVAVIGVTHPMYTTVYLTTVNGNGTIIPLDKELDFAQVLAFINHAEVDAIAYTAQFNGKFQEARAEIANVKYFFPIQPEEGYTKTEDTVSTDDLIAMGKEALEAGHTAYLDLEIQLEKRSAILFTSGTTGTSKGVMLSHNNLLATLNASTQATAYDDQSRFVSVLPIHHAYEMACGQLGMIAVGGEELINDSLKRILKNFQEYKPTSLILVPMVLETMHKKIWDEVRKKGKEKQLRALMKMNEGLLAVGIDVRKKLFGQITAAFGGELSSIVCGGAPLNPQIIRDFYHFGISVYEGYGITECAPLVSVNRPGDIRLRSVGAPVACVYAKIAYDEGQTTGEILVKGPNVMMGYYKDEAATAAVFTEDGYFRTGDIGYIKNGCIYITGRKKNVIILSNGKNVFPEEIEEYIGRVPTVLESVVLGRENQNGEVVITAIVVPDVKHPEIEGKTPAEVYDIIKKEITQINKHLPSFKHITNIEIRYEEFEKNTSKKIKRYKIK